MFPCTECGKNYASQTSLRRHIHNHSKTKKHQCSICGVIFYRRDLLSRHSKLHQAPATEKSVEGVSQTRADVGRQRCHTACQRCRELRTKCDGQQPCIACTKAESTCTYTRRSSRLSHPHVPPEAELPSPSTFSAADFEDLEGQLHLQFEPQDPLDTQVLQPPDSVSDPVNSSEVDQFPVPMDYQSSIGHNASSGHGFSSQMSMPFQESMAPGAGDPMLSMAAFVPDTMSWPWLAESLYLSPGYDHVQSHLEPVPHQYLAEVSALQPAVDKFTHDHSVQESDYESNIPTHDFRDQYSRALLPEARGHEGTANVGGSSGSSAPQSTTAQSQLIKDLVAFASTPESQNYSAFWRAMSPRVSDVFELPSDAVPKSSTLHHFCQMYLNNFGNQWSLFTKQNLDLNALRPLLFLVLTSIGAMYCGPAASKYGLMMHSQVFEAAITPSGIDVPETEFLALAQARLLLQVAALCFRQYKAFTHAQHLGALLISQARRMDLFSPLPAANLSTKFHQSKGIASDRDRLSLWLTGEARRRLAFGIFRGDTYTSALCATKPLILLEEIDLELPMCDAVWSGERMEPSMCLQMIEHDQTPGRGLWASDIFRITMDPDEAMPPLDPAGQEILIFGLQYPIWRFSRDQKLFERLTGNDHKWDIGGTPFAAKQASVVVDSGDLNGLPSPALPWFGGSIQSEAHRLDSASRVMSDLGLERTRLLTALGKWEHALPLVKAFTRTDKDRTSLFSALILYHLSHLRMYAPLEELHQVQYRQADNRTVDDDLIALVRHWANSSRGQLAAERACNIWSMIAKEARFAPKKRVKFNLLAFTSLHHGAVVLWAYAGAHDFTCSQHMGETSLLLEPLNLQHSAVQIRPEESTRMLRSFVDLYSFMSHARLSLFSPAAEKLSTLRFPADSRK